MRQQDEAAEGAELPRTAATGEPLSGWLDELLPPGAVCFEQVGDLWGSLLAEEAELLSARAVSKRRLELAAGRTCARAALGKLGLAPQPILRGPRGEPLWPAQIVGSITHAAGYCAAAVAPRDACASLGIDAEPNQRLPDGVLRLVARPREQAWIAAAGAGEICWDRLLFSMKESVFKTWYPLARTSLEFGEAEVEINGVEQTFEAKLLRVPGVCPSVIRGRFRTAGSTLLTCAFVPAGGR